MQEMARLFIYLLLSTIFHRTYRQNIIMRIMIYDWKRMTSCTICGSRFGDRICPNCETNVCSSCVVYGKNTCVKCNKVTAAPPSFLRRNLAFILLFVAFWFFVSGLYPFPYMMAIGQKVDFRVIQPVLIATGIMLIPFVFMMFAWNRRAQRIRK
jgi:hypothetical protein